MPDAAETYRDELAIYGDHKAEWLGTHRGEFVLIKADEVAGFYKTFEQAIQVGLNKFGPVPFFVKEIVEKDDVQKTPALYAGLLFASPQ